ncbi:sterol desaturase family protein [Salibacteraceae bacterium]|nr:sterol desaturase family protein [Salibacteraceae bacterium]
MGEYLDAFINGYKGYAQYLWYEITHPTLHNYFYWLIAISVFFMVLEWVKPWRKEQPKFRKDFWLDAFYMFFNFFLFSLIVYNGISDVVVKLMNNALQGLTGISSFTFDPLNGFPYWSILLIGFLVRDFVQWNVHRLLHAKPRLWEFHKVHHSVKEMGFAAHLRYHWMETIVYRTIEYLPLALLGIGLYDFFIIHLFSLAIGHHNHANVKVTGFYKAGVLGLLVCLFIIDQTGMELINAIAWIVGMPILFALSLGPWMKYIFNSPEMHIWHHVRALPEGRIKGINFGISLALWDYIFGSAVIPKDGRDIELGFDGVEEFPDSFAGQFTYGLVQKKEEKTS